jgi:hypothetical protein
MAKGKLRAVGTVKELLAITKTEKLEDAFITLASESEVLL